MMATVRVSAVFKTDIRPTVIIRVWGRKREIIGVRKVGGSDEEVG